MIVYRMTRGESDVAEVVRLDNGKCIVAWPTSVIVYDSEEAAREVHIAHMAGRGEKTMFIPVCGSGRSFDWGRQCAVLDDNEGTWCASITDNYRHDRPVAPVGWTDRGEPIDQLSFLLGYIAQASAHLTDTQFRSQLAEHAQKQRAARGPIVEQVQVNVVRRKHA